MIEDFRDGTPAEYAAFFVLRQYITGDMKAAAIKLLENGYDGEYIASCVFELPSELETEEACFEKALLETGLPRLPTVKESIWLAIRYYLVRVVKQSDRVSIDLVGKMIVLRDEWANVELFPRPDCDAYFEERKKKFKYAGSKFAKQEWGLENLIGIYYAMDDWSYNKNKTKLNITDWYEENKRIQIENAVEEAIRIRDKYFSVSSDLPEDLKSVEEFL